MKQVALSVVVILACTSAAFSGDSPAGQGRLLFDRAAGLSRIRTKQFAPYSLEYDFRLFQNNSVMAGSYDEVWVSAKQWRKTVSVSGGYNETIVRNGMKDWVAHNQNAEPVLLQELRRTLDRIADVRLQHQEEITGVHDENRGEAIFKCVDIHEPGPVNRTLCFDPQSGELRSIRREGVVTEIGGYSQTGAGLWPSKVRISNGEEVLEADLMKLDRVAAPDSSLFEPPAGAQARLDCDKVIPPKAIYALDPEYPKGMRKVKYAMVLLRAEVNEKGRADNIGVQNSSNHGFDQAAMEAVKKWLFQPATCAGTPVSFKINIEVNFRRY